MTSWSAFATITRSKGSVSSAVRLRVDVRGSTRTIRPNVSVRPETSPTMPTRSPTTTLRRPSSLAFIAVTSLPASAPSAPLVMSPRRQV
jgi:hypothetical protein